MNAVSGHYACEFQVPGLPTSAPEIGAFLHSLTPWVLAVGRGNSKRASIKMVYSVAAAGAAVATPA
jgi:hypothetical protein